MTARCALPCNGHSLLPPPQGRAIARDAAAGSPPPERAGLSHVVAPQVYLPLKGGGRFAKQTGWGSLIPIPCKLDPHPNPPPFRGREHAARVAPHAITRRTR
jgi:hypothetical protein